MRAAHGAGSRSAPETRDMTHGWPPRETVGGFVVSEADMLEILTKRADFVAATRKAKRVHTPAFTLQIRTRGDDAPARVGYTCSKKVGNAVARNRAKRRLREVARIVLPDHAAPGTDYVFIGRPKITAAHPFTAMCDDLRDALT